MIHQHNIIFTVILIMTAMLPCMEAQLTQAGNQNISGSKSQQNLAEIENFLEDFKRNGIKSFMVPALQALFMKLNDQDLNKAFEHLRDDMKVHQNNNRSLFSDYLLIEEGILSAIKIRTEGHSNITPMGLKPKVQKKDNTGLKPAKKISLRSRTPVKACAEIVRHSTKHRLNEANIKRLKMYYNKCSTEHQTKIKQALEVIYHKMIREEPQHARTLARAHSELVQLHSTHRPMLSSMIAPQQPHADAKQRPCYGKTPSQIKGCELVVSMGGDILKLAPNRKHLKRQNQDISELKDRLDEVIQHPLYQEIFDMDYKVMFLWAHGQFKATRFHDGMDDWEREALYDEFYKFTTHLLERYSGSNKTFMLGNWEGDWMLMGGVPEDPKDASKAIPEASFQGMIDWINIRAQAIEDAKKNTQHRDVQVYLYCEINHVSLHLEEGAKRVIDGVLPYTKVDYVSISSYDIQGHNRWTKKVRQQHRHENSHRAFDAVEAMLPPRDIAGKRVFTGEIGYTIYNLQKSYDLSTEEAEWRQCLEALENAKCNLEWGMPFWLWWAVFDNEPIEEEGAIHEHGGADQFRGFGIYDQVKDRKRQLYHEFETYYAWYQKYLQSFKLKHRRLPDHDELRKAVIEQLEVQITALQDRRP
jgi:hypothetical protein